MDKTVKEGGGKIDLASILDLLNTYPNLGFAAILKSFMLSIYL